MTLKGRNNLQLFVKLYAIANLYKYLINNLLRKILWKSHFTIIVIF